MIEYTVKVSDDGSKFWFLNGKLHREDGPACEFSDGSKSWFLNGKLHREDGPAVEYTNGTKYWYLNGKLHRSDDPAIEHADGTKSWYLKGKLHREDGPAIEYTTGAKYWCLNDKGMTEQEHKKAVVKITCEGKEVVVDGATYVLKEKQNDQHTANIGRHDDEKPNSRR